MDHANCNHHVPCDPESGDTPQKSEDQTDAAEQFCVDGQQSEGPGNMHLLRKGINGAAESISAKPAEHLLCTVCKENGPKHKAENRQGEVVGSSHKPAKHDRFLLCRRSYPFSPVRSHLQMLIGVTLFLFGEQSK